MGYVKGIIWNARSISSQNPRNAGEFSPLFLVYYGQMNECLKYEKEPDL